MNNSKKMIEKFSIVEREGELAVVLTGDGSATLYRFDSDVSYRSLFGAVTESRTVFIGGTELESCPLPWRVLEIGFGAGLNFFNTAGLFFRREGEGEPALYYAAVERNPVPPELIRAVFERSPTDFPPELFEDFISFYREGVGKAQGKMGWEGDWEGRRVRFQLFISDWSDLEYRPEEPFCAVYYDPFGPGDEPDSWDYRCFEKLRGWISEGTKVATYSCARSVKEALKRAGFSYRKYPGPPGKREFLVAAPLFENRPGKKGEETDVVF